MGIGMRMREGQDILLLLVLKHADTGTTQWTPPPRRRASSAGAQAGVVQVAEEWATTVLRKRCRMDGRGAGGQYQGDVSAATQQSTRGGARLYTNNSYPVRRLGKDEEDEVVPSFSS